MTSDLDRVTERTLELVTSVSIPIFAEHVPPTLTGERDPERALRKLRKRHPGLLCVTLGTAGSMALDGDRAPFPVVRTPFEERDAQFSPDGKWIAYQSNESGQRNEDRQTLAPGIFAASAARKETRKERSRQDRESGPAFQVHYEFAAWQASRLRSRGPLG